MAIYELWADGESLYTQAWNVFDMPGRRGLPEREQGGATPWGFEGTTPVIGAYKPRQFSLKIWVASCRPDGSEAVNPRDQFERNMSKVLSLFSRPDLITLTQRYPDGSVRYCRVRVVGVTDAEFPPGQEHTVARLTVVLENPYVWWTDRLEPVVFSSTVLGPFVTIDPLDSNGAACAPITDSVISIQGPITNPLIENPYGGRVYAWTTVPAGQTLILDNNKLVAALSTGKNMITEVVATGSGPRFLDLHAPYSLRVSGHATSGETRWQVSAFPKFT